MGKEKAELDRVVSTIDQLYSGISDTEELFLLAQEESDDDLLQEAESDLVKLEQSLAELEFRRMFSGSMDSANAYLDIQAGSGGTEAQDWAEMLLRMYLRWSEAKGFKAELVEVSGGEVAGIKVRPCTFRESSHLDGCAPKPACTVWLGNHLLTPGTDAIHLSHRFFFPLR